VTSNRAYAERKQIRLHTRLDEHLPEIQADDTRITQVINNLVDNAIKYAPPGSEVTIHTRHTGNQVCCQVSDEGPGLTDADMDKVFTRYARLSNRPTGGETSTGLGLAICKHIVELHGGEIGVRNNPGKGCTFWFCLPVDMR
ncbi:MAG TPA: HAMP domain-containing histidine kinase, partial [Gammaproteobacteria bacterium]|nr:HAMP domain-containing histidine kinase [Gammaproteobacteria bacterium]